MRSAAGRMLLLAAAVTLASCDDLSKTLRDEINKLWPPVSSLDQRMTSVTNSRAGLDIAPPTISAHLSRQLIETSLSAQIEAAASRFDPKQFKLSKVRVRLRGQGIEVSADVEGQIPTTPVAFRGQATATATARVTGNLLEIRAAFDRIVLDEARIEAEDATLDALLPLVNQALHNYLMNLNGAIQPLDIPLDIHPIPPVDPQSIAVKGLTVSGNPLTLPTPIVKAAAILIDGDGVDAMAAIELGNGGTAPAGGATALLGGPKAAGPVSEETFKRGFDDLRGKFNTVRTNEFGAAPRASDTSLAVSRGFVERFANLALSQSAWHLSYTLPEVRNEFANDIRPYSAPNIDCSLKADTRNCRFEDGCQHNHDTRSCGQDVDLGPLGKHHVNDPICETAKAGQNQIYDRAFDICIGGAKANDVTCEAEKGTQNALYAAQKLGCETNKSALQELEKLAHVGHISGNLAATGTADAALGRVEFSNDLHDAHLDATIAGHADVAAFIKFDPDTAGRAICTVGWSGTLRTTVSLSSQNLALVGHIAGDKPDAIAISLDPAGLSIQLDPPPVQALFGQHPELVVLCSPIVQGAAVAGLTLRALQQNDLPSEITGQYHDDIPAAEFDIPLAPFEAKLGPVSLSLKPALSEKAVWLTAGSSALAPTR